MHSLHPCHDYSDLLVDLSDGELAADQRDAVLEHAAACPACRAELSRLDASLARLRTGVQAAKSPRHGLPSRRNQRVKSHRAVAAAAAVALVCLISIPLATWRAARLSPTANAIQPRLAAPEQSHAETASNSLKPSSAGPAPLLTEEQALRHIALIEQQARLRTSLGLMPKDPWYADERAENERLLAAFISATRDVKSNTH